MQDWGKLYNCFQVLPTKKGTKDSAFLWAWNSWLSNIVGYLQKKPTSMRDFANHCPSHTFIEIYKGFKKNLIQIFGVKHFI